VRRERLSKPARQRRWLVRVHARARTPAWASDTQTRVVDRTTRHDTRRQCVRGGTTIAREISKVGSVDARTQRDREEASSSVRTTHTREGQQQQEQQQDKREQRTQTAVGEERLSD